MRLFLFSIACFAVSCNLFSIEQRNRGKEGAGSTSIKISNNFKKTSVATEYDSDSENEEGYEYKGLAPLPISKDKCGKKCLALYRGIHFSPSNFSSQDRSVMRRSNDAGKAMYCSAAYDLAEQRLGDDPQSGVEEKALKIKNRIIRQSPEERHKFQQLYSNQYDHFHKCLKGNNEYDCILPGFPLNKNPQVSTSEECLHPGKYGCGLKFLGKDIEILDPEYDLSGVPKHPYLGKLFVILVSEDQLDELDPYFVVYGHANDDIAISNHFRKNVLSEREVSMPGLIPGNSVVLSIPLKVPSFAGDYKPHYEEKFGISKRSYSIRKGMIIEGNKETVKTLLRDVILPHLAKKMERHIKEECKSKGINLIYKQPNGSFGQALPHLQNITDYRKQIKQAKQIK